MQKEQFKKLLLEIAQQIKNKSKTDGPGFIYRQGKSYLAQTFSRKLINFPLLKQQNEFWAINQYLKNLEYTQWLNATKQDQWASFNMILEQLNRRALLVDDYDDDWIQKLKKI